MEIEKLIIPDVILIKPDVYQDVRGYFTETFSAQRYHEAGIDADFVQDNESMSMKGVLRGVHFQKGEYAQAKLVRVVKGAVWDVAVDIRKGSPTFGKYVSALLTSENKHQMYIPRGFAHGFLVMEDNTVFSYKCDNYYAPEFATGIRYDDPSVNIQWPSIDRDLQLSQKDCTGLLLEDIEFF